MPCDKTVKIKKSKVNSWTTKQWREEVAPTNKIEGAFGISRVLVCQRRVYVYAYAGISTLVSTYASLVYVWFRLLDPCDERVSYQTGDCSDFLHLGMEKSKSRARATISSRQCRVSCSENEPKFVPVFLKHGLVILFARRVVQRHLPFSLDRLLQLDQVENHVLPFGQFPDDVIVELDL